MKADKLYRIIGLIDDDLVEEAQSATGRPKIRYIGFAAIAACAVVIMAVMLPHISRSRSADTMEYSCEAAVAEESAPEDSPAQLSEAPEEQAIEEAIEDENGEYATVTEAAPAAGYSYSADKSAAPDLSDITIKAEETEGNCIATDTDFIITAVGSTLDELQNMLVIDPDMDFTLQQISDEQYRLDPEDDLPVNSYVNLSLTDGNGSIVKRWVFKTQPD